MKITHLWRTCGPLLVLVLLALLAPAGPAFAQQEVAPSAEAPPPKPDFLAVPNPGSDFWRAVRGRAPEEPTFYGDLPPTPLLGASQPISGTTQVRGTDTGVLVNEVGSRWTRFRMTELLPIGLYLMGGVLGLIVLFYLIRGSVKIPGGRSGKVLHRFSLYDRVAHWFLAVAFIVLAITGLLVSYGRPWIIPIMGREAFGTMTAGAKIVHNWTGLLFPIALVMVFLSMVRENLYQKGDLLWLLKGGGFLGGHASANKYNAGEKILFWLVILFGLLVSASGLILNFPIFGQSRLFLQQSHVVHSAVAIVFIALVFGHIYMATLGVPGTLQGMTKGYVDANWAKSHHDKWYEKEVAEQGLKDESGIESAGGRKPVAGQASPGTT
jgi:formate dehydrogenase subunit gamma